MNALGEDSRVVSRSRRTPEPWCGPCTTGAEGPPAGARAWWRAIAGRKRRRGAAVVEFAIVAPLFFLLVLGMIEYGRLVMVQQILTNAAREGARKAVLEGIGTSDVQTAVQNYLQGANIDEATVTVVTNSPVAPDYAASMTVTVQIPFAAVSWLPSPIYLKNYQMSASTTMRREDAK